MCFGNEITVTALYCVGRYYLGHQVIAADVQTSCNMCQFKLLFLTAAVALPSSVYLC
jgi:hypothetical protein